MNLSPPSKTHQTWRTLKAHAESDGRAGTVNSIYRDGIQDDSVSNLFSWTYIIQCELTSIQEALSYFLCSLRDWKDWKTVSTHTPSENKLSHLPSLSQRRRFQFFVKETMKQLQLNQPRAEQGRRCIPFLTVHRTKLRKQRDK